MSHHTILNIFFSQILNIIIDVNVSSCGIYTSTHKEYIVDKSIQHRMYS